jgi:hypothetical protein
MSLKIDNKNIFFLLPESRYAVSDRIDAYMDEDFTLHVTAKLFPETLTEKESFMIARNGMHSGISAFKDQHGDINAMFTYWFRDKQGNPKPKQLFHRLTDSELNEFNKYTMICDHTDNKKISCYVNDNLIGDIFYKNDKKEPYANSFYWFGCGSMIGPEEHRGFGEFEYSMTFVLNKAVPMNIVNDLIENYEEKYTDVVFNDLRKLKNDYKLKENFAFFSDFKHYNRYKVWDLSFNGNYPQFYIEHNIYF